MIESFICKDVYDDGDTEVDYSDDEFEDGYGRAPSLVAMIPMILMMMIIVMMKMLIVKKNNRQSAKFGGNDGGFHLEANMSAAEKHGGESRPILIM